MVIRDWHDGPLEGIAEIVEPRSYWHFRMIGVRTSVDDLDDRVYLFSQIAKEAVERISEKAEPFEKRPLIWPFDSFSNHAEVEVGVDEVVASAGPPVLLVRSNSFREVAGIWRYIENSSAGRSGGAPS